MIWYDNVNIWYSYCHRQPCERAIWTPRGRNPWIEKHWLTLEFWLYYWKQEQLHHLAEHETESVMSPHWCTRRDKQLRCSIPGITGPQLSDENALSTPGVRHPVSTMEQEVLFTYSTYTSWRTAHSSQCRGQLSARHLLEGHTVRPS